ncbi:MAG: ATPase [Chitinophagaceae bacterium]|nr:ATPase [Chitinophagaceae bacterium]
MTRTVNDTNSVGLTEDAGWQIGVRKTIPASFNEVWDFLFSDKGLSTWLGNTQKDALVINASYKTKEGTGGIVRLLTDHSHIRLTWKKKDWKNVSLLQLRIIPAKNKTTVSFHHEKLQDAQQRKEMKTHWDVVMEKISQQLIAR